MEVRIPLLGQYGEVSVNSPAGVPIYQFKTVIVAAGILLFIQGLAQVMPLPDRDAAQLVASNRSKTFSETEDLLMQKAN